MDSKSSDQKPTSDDQEIAKVLAGVSEQIDNTGSDDTTGLHFEETTSAPAGDPAEPVIPTPPPLPTITSNPSPILPPVPPLGDPMAQPPVAPMLTPPSDMAAPTLPPSPAMAPLSAEPVAVDPALEGIKKDALNELRPLVDKLNVSPEEKFDTYLLLLRSTDDKSLLAPAHEAAKGIADEARRAQALLDVIKEIDYLSHEQPAA